MFAIAGNSSYVRLMQLTLRNLEQAVALRRQIDSLEKRFAALIGGGSAQSGTGAARNSGTGSTRSRGGGSRNVSAATRAKLAAAARARWARERGGKSAAPARGGKKKGGGLTAAGRRRLSQLMKARWAARRRGKKS
jgi:hypothetical protein